MKVHLIAVGQKQPDWVNMAFHEYEKRLKQEVTLNLIEIPSESNSKNQNPSDIKHKEASRIRSKIPSNSHLITLDEHGHLHTSQSFATEMQNWLGSGKSVCMVIGGSEGLDQSLIDEADECWSLSQLTLPHGLVRVLVAEQLYRVWSILKCHPYHRS